MIDPELRAQLRKSILDNLAKQPAYALPVDTLRRWIARARDVEGAFEIADLLDALAFLEGFGYVRQVRRPLSGLRDWQITSEGIAFLEGQNG